MSKAQNRPLLLGRGEASTTTSHRLRSSGDEGNTDESRVSSRGRPHARLAHSSSRMAYKNSLPQAPLKKMLSMK